MIHFLKAGTRHFFSITRWTFFFGGETTWDDLCAVGVVFWYPGDGAKPYDEGPMNRLNRLNRLNWGGGWSWGLTKRWVKFEVEGLRMMYIVYSYIVLFFFLAGYSVQCTHCTFVCLNWETWGSWIWNYYCKWAMEKTWLFRLYRGLYYPIPSYMGIVISQLQGFCHCIRASPMERFSTWSTQNADIYLIHIYIYTYIL